jgi:hypothetical protein
MLFIISLTDTNLHVKLKNIANFIKKLFLLFYLYMNDNIYINNIDYKLGSQYTNETLNDEFKKFTFDREEITSRHQRNFFEIFFGTGKINSIVDDYIKKRISLYLKNYIPKYTVCFFNSDERHNLSHSDSFLYIGIDDNGIITGIPVKDTENLNELHNFIETEIEKIITENVFDNRIDHSLIKSCIESYIYIINNSYTGTCKELMEKNKEKIKTLDKERTDMFLKVYSKKKYVLQIRINAERITVGNFKKNDSIIERILRNLIENDEIPVTYDKSSQEAIIFFKDLMVNFDTQKYDKDYEINLINKPRIKNIKNNIKLYNALGTFFHLQIKKKSESHKKIVTQKYLDEREQLAHMEEEINRNLTEKNLLYYNIDTHVDTITESSKFILIKIRFDHKKYNNYIKTLEPHKLKFKNNQDFLVATKRKLKYLGNKLDPECHIVSKHKINKNNDSENTT